MTVLLFVKNRRQIFCVGCVVDEKKREKSEMNFNDEVFGKYILNLSESTTIHVKNAKRR